LSEGYADLILLGNLKLLILPKLIYFGYYLHLALLKDALVDSVGDYVVRQLIARHNPLAHCAPYHLLGLVVVYLFGCGFFHFKWAFIDQKS